MNPLLGGCFSLLYGVGVAADAIGSAGSGGCVPRHVIAARARGARCRCGVRRAGSWTAPARRSISASPGSRAHSPVITLLLSLGPILVPALAGLRRVPNAASRARSDRRRAEFSSACSCSTSFGSRKRPGWDSAPARSCSSRSRSCSRGRFASMRPRMRGALAAVILVDRPADDARSTPGTRRTSATAAPGRASAGRCGSHPTSSRCLRGYARTRRATAIVQMEPMVRGREHWTLIPSFAGRRMAAGLPISLLPLPEYLRAVRAS